MLPAVRRRVWYRRGVAARPGGERLVGYRNSAHIAREEKAGAGALLLLVLARHLQVHKHRERLTIHALQH